MVLESVIMNEANLFTDDILLTLAKPCQSTPQVLKLIDYFGKLSGYRVY